MARSRRRNYPNTRRRTKLSCTVIFRLLQSTQRAIRICMAYLVCCGPTLTSGILTLISMVANQGVADLYTHIRAYPRDSVREARGWVSWRLGRCLSVRSSWYPIHNFFGSDLIPIPRLLCTFPLLHSLDGVSVLNSFTRLIACPDMLRMSRCCSNFLIARCTYIAAFQFNNSM